MKVHWTDAAEAQLDAIYAYIAQNSTTYALRTVDRHPTIIPSAQRPASPRGGIVFIAGGRRRSEKRKKRTRELARNHRLQAPVSCPDRLGTGPVASTSPGSANRSTAYILNAVEYPGTG